MIAQGLFIMLQGILGYQLQVQNIPGPQRTVVPGSYGGSVSGCCRAYPALVMAGMNPIKALKNSTNAKNASGLLSLRRSLCGDPVCDLAGADHWNDCGRSADGLLLAGISVSIKKQFLLQGSPNIIARENRGLETCIDVTTGCRNREHGRCQFDGAIPCR